MNNWLIVFAVIVMVWVARQMIREYRISRHHKKLYEAQVKEILTHPSSRVKGRFE